MLILGRSCSGAHFDQAVGVIPQHIDAEDRWRSLWNGAGFATRRIEVGTIIGLVGIGLLQWPSLHGISRTVGPGLLGRLAAASAAAFALSGVITHLTCGKVILDYKRASLTDVESATGTQPSPRSATRLFGASAIASLGALALFSCSLTVAALRHRGTASISWSSVTPFPCVMVTLLTFGALPAPVGGYARPASISIGLLSYFVIAAGSAER